MEKDIHRSDSSSMHRRGSFATHGDNAKTIAKKQAEGRGDDIALPAYDGETDFERRGSIIAVRDMTHRKLKARHIQLIGIGGTIGRCLLVLVRALRC